MELRVLAHFSKDKNMMEVFNNNGDIHGKTMELTGTKRKIAKGLNFGLIYGMGSRSLAKTLNIKEHAANEYMDRFFSGYPLVQPFIQRIQSFAARKHYVEMISGRRRNFKELVENQWFSSIARQAINSKIQGSSADIMKIAMIKLYKKLKPLDAHILIQIHDEVIIEAPEENIEELGKLVVETMEEAVKLHVPLRAGLAISDHWIKG